MTKRSCFMPATSLAIVGGLVGLVAGCTWDPPPHTGIAVRPTTPSSSGGGGRTGVNPGNPAGSRCSWAIPDRADCAGKFYNGHGITPDIYVLFDVSGSMATKDDGALMRIDAVRDALASFLDDPGSSGIGVGIGYFGTQPLSCACTSCNPADYATPAVAIDALPGQLGALTTSLGGATPTGETPTGAALRGACGYAGGYKQAHPGHDVVLLLVTDGEPQAPLTSRAGTCNPTLADATAAASACLTGGVPVRTYVLGVGPSLTNLNQIAAAGGTQSAHLVAGGGASDILTELNKIRTDAAIPCTLQIPQPTGTDPVDLRTVNVVYADASCHLTTIGNVSAASACTAAQGGWYYDRPDQPTKIQLCEGSCAQVAMPGTELQVSIGCSTQIVP